MTALGLDWDWTDSRILYALAGGKATANFLANELSLPRIEVSKRLRKLKRRGKVETEPSCRSIWRISGGPA